ncbi:hypothetical protein GK047_11175 [Paenibacillus sp. SYP-B3998]|uniref:Uncharacterized protein n=1 Tax=Paenibacillus sp. SYP-B3998 TaxID=2678564 RepID=A0A6G3ZY08_9BACL|nr:hypothetical protein [Paenibacillus sp. SYP-B3998]NEW06574.1 hypothetical protein [Paenibacillus sp. SYP-B3998]
MIYGTKLLETDTELFVAALTQTPVYVWSLDPQGVYYQIATGLIVKYTPDQAQIQCVYEDSSKQSLWYSRDSNEFSIRFE